MPLFLMSTKNIVPKSLKKLSFILSHLPGIGPKTARRLAMYLFSRPKEELYDFADTLKLVKKNTKQCSFCKVLSDTDPCPVCADVTRDLSKLCIVKSSLDVYTLEKSSVYNGLYLVLNQNLEDILYDVGRTNVLLKEITENIFNRIKQVLKIQKNKHQKQQLELIFTFGTTIEEQTILVYVKQAINRSSFKDKVHLSRLGMGLSSGSSIDFVDMYTLKEAFEGRRKLG